MGYKVEQFVKTVDENLICPICKSVFKDPMICEDGHTFCKMCIEQRLKENNECPVDGRVMDNQTISPNIALSGILKKLDVFCHTSYESKGKAEEDLGEKDVQQTCDWTGKLQTLAKHRESCPFQQVQCPNGNCNTNIQGRELEDHDKMCRYKELECDEKCGVTLIRRELPKHKRNDCPEVRLSCPNGCETSIKRKNINTHAENCPFQQVQCPNVNCSTNMQRRELEDHDKICEYKNVKCGNCRKLLLRNMFIVHKNHECPEEKFPCPNSCMNPETGQMNKIKRMDLDDHLRNKCAKTILDCPFKDQGCPVQVERQHVDKHVQDNMAAHMMLLAKQYSSLTKQNASLTEQCSSLSQENHVLKNELRKTKRGLKELQVEVISRSRYVWTILDFPAQAKKYTTSTWMRSPTFWLCGNSWFLKLYPSGDRKSKEFVSLSLVLSDEDSLVSKPGKQFLVASREVSVSHVRITVKNQAQGKSITRDEILNPRFDCPGVVREAAVISKLMRVTDALSPAFCDVTDGSFTVTCILF